jgi:hypothetical protein
MLKNYGYQTWALCKFFYELENMVNKFTAEIKDNPTYAVELVKSGEFEKLIIANKELLEKNKIAMLQPDANIIAGHRMSNVYSQFRRIMRLQQEGTSNDKLLSAMQELKNRIEDDLESCKYVAIDSSKEQFFSNENLFGDKVADKFPASCEDISEAGKCFALSRYTAAVFHLMRAMEHAIHILGSTHDVTIADKNGNSLSWGGLVANINAKTVSLPEGEIKRKWHEAGSLLYYVKEAWRNGTMHPKQTYTEEEAIAIFGTVKAFVVSLVDLA